MTVAKDTVVGDEGNGHKGSGILSIADNAKLTTGGINTALSDTHGEVYIDNATLELTNSSKKVFGNFNTSGDDADIIQITNNAAISTVGSSTDTFVQENTAVISGTGTLIKQGDAALVLTADNTYSGGTNVQAGTLQLGNGLAAGTAGSGAITLSDGTTLALNHGANDFTLDNAISGSGKISQLAANTGTTTVTNDNTGFGGNVEVHGGTLQVGNGGDTGDIGSGSVTLDADTNLKINHGSDYTLDNTVSGAGNLEQAGAGETTVTQKNTYSGKTTVSGGVLEIAGNAGIDGTSEVLVGNGAANSAADGQIKLIVDADGTLSTANNGKVTLDNGDLTVNGTADVGNIVSADGEGDGLDSVHVGSSGKLTTHLADGDVLFDGFQNADAQDVVEVNGTLETAVASGTATQNSAAPITGSGSLDKTGSGTLVLTAANTYSGTTQIEAGTLQAGDGTNNGTFGTGDIEIASGATASINHAAGDTYTLSQKISGAGTLAQDGGTTVLTNSDNSVGETDINNGTLQVAGGLASPIVNVGDGSGAAETAKLMIDNDASVTATDVHVQSDGYLNNAGSLNAENGTVTVDGGALETSGSLNADTLAVNNSNGQTATVKITGGTTDVNATEINDGTVTVDDGATLDGGEITVGNGDSNNATLTNNGSVLATDVTVKSDGSLVNNAGHTLTASGDVTVDGGSVNNAGNLNADGDLTVDNGGSLVSSGSTAADKIVVDHGGDIQANGGTLSADTEVDVNDGKITVASGAVLDSPTLNVGDGSGAAKSAQLENNGTLQNVQTINVKSDGYLNLAGTSNNADTLNVDGGSVDVNNAATFANTNVNEGSLTVAAGKTLDGGAVKVGDGDDDQATLNNNGNLTASSVDVNKDGTLNNNSGSSLAASGDVTVDGGTVNNSGSLTAANGTLTVDNGGTLNNETGGSTTANKLVVDNDGAVNVNGGTVAATTETDLNDGKITVASGAELSSPTLKVGDGADDPETAVLENSGTVTSSDVTVASDGKFDNKAGGVLNAENGSVTVDGGKLSNEAGASVTAQDVTVQNDGTLDNAGSLTASDKLTVDGGTLNNETGGTTTADTLEVNNDGVANVNGGTVAATTTDIKDGDVNVAQDGTLQSGTLNVGDGIGDPNTANLNTAGTVTADNLNVQKDGNLHVTGGTTTATDHAEVNGGNVTVDDGKLNIGEQGDQVLSLNGGNLTVNGGEVDAANVASDPARAGDTDAKIQVGANGSLNLNPAAGETLFDGFDTAQGDVVQIDGKLNVNVADGDVSQNANADISGSGTLTKDGAGTLELTADNNQLGNVVVNNGELVVAPDSKLTVADETAVNDGTLTVANGGELDTGKLTAGDGDDVPAVVNVNGTVNADEVATKSDGTINVGDESGNPSGTLAVGNDITMDGGNLNVNSGSTVSADNIVTNDTADEEASKVNVAQGGTLTLTPDDGDTLFDGFNTADGGKDSINVDGTLNVDVASGEVIQPVSAPISGSGTVNKDGDGTFTVKADNPFDGDVNVNDGTLNIVEGGKLGNADVNVGTNGSLSVDEAGTSLGSLNLDGNLTVVATPTGHTQIDVSGDVTLGSNSSLFTDIANSNENELASGDYSNVITAGGTISGNFGSYDDNSQLFDFVPYVTDDKKSVGLTPYASQGNSLSEIADEFGKDRAKGAAAALDTVFNRDPSGDLSRLFYTIRDKKEAMNALLQSLPTVAGASSQIVGDSSSRLSSLADVSMRCGSELQTGADRKVWAKTYGSQSHQKDYLGAAGYSGDSYGVAAGADVCYNQTRIGVMVGYANDFVRSTGSPSNQKVTADTVLLGVYGSTPVSSAVDVDFKAGVGYSDVSTKRTIDFGYTHTRADADYGNKIAYAGVGANYRAFASDKLEINPFVRADYQVVHNDSYRESGAGILNLYADSGNYQALVTQVGVEAKARLAEKATLGARASVGYNLLDDKPSVTAAFAGASDLKFTTEGAQHGRTSGMVGLDLNYYLTPAARLSVGYDAVVRKGYFEQVPSVSFKMKF